MARINENQASCKEPEESFLDPEVLAALCSASSTNGDGEHNTRLRVWKPATRPEAEEVEEVGQENSTCHPTKVEVIPPADPAPEVEPEVEPEPPPFPVVSMLGPEGRNEVANADRLVLTHADDLRYVREWGEWVRWDNRRWERDIGGLLVQELGVALAKGLWLHLAHEEPTEAQRNQMISFCGSSNRAAAIHNAIMLARSKVPIGVEQLDRHDYLLNLPNGTLDLKTGRLRAPRRDDLITKLCPTEYDPAALCPRWNRFLMEVFRGAKPLINYLRRAFGYSLTGDVREQILLLFWGRGSNGKSTLVETLTDVLGPDYTCAPPKELFAVGRYDRHPTEIMTLQGRRLAATVETGAGIKLNETLIKHLTGGDKVTGRELYKNFSTFAPTHKLLLSTNHRPRIVGTDYAIWRRVKLIHFGAVFAKGRRDNGLRDKLRAEAKGILAWMVRGCREWQQVGLDEPECVRVATEAYREEEDIVGRFLKECCVVGPKLWTTAAELLRAMSEWDPEGELTANFLGRELRERGFVSTQGTTFPYKGIRIWKGLQLRDRSS
jgi:putative DNA primase/helicase